MIVQRTLAIVCVFFVTTSAWAAGTPRGMYTATLEREQSVRASLASDRPAAKAAKQARAVVATYQRIVARYPKSSYAGNALWQAGRLSIDLFFRFNQPGDRAAAFRLLHRLQSAYPGSTLAKRAPEQLSRLTVRHAVGSAVPPARASASPREVDSASVGEGRGAGIAPQRPLETTGREPAPLASRTIAAGPRGGTATIKAIRRSVLADTVRITLEFDGEVSFRDERVSNPTRVLVDLPETHATPALLDRTVRFDGDSDIVRQVRIGQHADDTTRVVIDAAGVSSYSVYPLYTPYRLVIDCIRGTEPLQGPPLVPLASRTLLSSPAHGLPALTPRAAALIAAAATPLRPPLLATRRVSGDWGHALPNTAPAASALIIASVRALERESAPPPLAARRVFVDWKRTLPNASPRAAALIGKAVKAMEVPAPARPLASRKVSSGVAFLVLPVSWPAATRLISDSAKADQAEEPGPLRGRRLRTAWGRALPSMSPRATALIAKALREEATLQDQGLLPSTTKAEPAAEAAAAPPPANPTKNSAGGYSLARQLGLRVSRIVIDPGHGGHDPGAKGQSVNESELVLDVALRLEKLLQETLGTEVILTRRTDDFVPLPERTALANRENADLFLSIHANASDRPAVAGVETYFLNFATNLSAAAVAARENAASGQAMGALPDLLKAIALNNKLDESRDFAAEVQRALVDRLRSTHKGLKDLGVKQAPFAVLIGAAMPSVLAEISFVTNTQEARLLRTNAYRDHIAEALFKAIRSYQAALKNAGSVAAHH